MHRFRLFPVLLMLAFALCSPVARAEEVGPLAALLLEAGDAGTTGATPFSGTVRWWIGQGTDGGPTLRGRVAIPARGLELALTLQPNSEADLPATHLVELNFTLRGEFTGGSVASVPGLLLKSEQLVQGQPLVGASARVVDSDFLFAMADFPKEREANLDLLRKSAYLDIALVYGTGRRALLTLERNAAALAQFAEIERLWGGLPAERIDLGPVAILGTALAPDLAGAEADRLGKRYTEALDGRAITRAPTPGTGSAHQVYLVVATGTLQEAVSLCADISAAGGICTPAGDGAPIALPD